MVGDVGGGGGGQVPDAAKAPAPSSATEVKSTFRVLAAGLRNAALGNAVRVAMNIGKAQIDVLVSVDAFNATLKTLLEG